MTPSVKEAEGISMITPDRLENLVRCLRTTLGVPGDLAEFGVFKGGSARVIAREVPQKSLHLFDTFSGLPHSELREYDPENYLHKGDFDAGGYMLAMPTIDLSRIQVHAGLFHETIKSLGDLRFSFVHVDCDLYMSAVEAIRYFWQRLNVGGAMFFDDYGCKFTGVTTAVNAAFREDEIEKQSDMYGNQIGAAVWKRSV